MSSSMFELGDPYQKLDQEPADFYDSDIEALEKLMDREYDQVSNVATSLTPRTNHEVFKLAYRGEEPAVVAQGHVDKITDVLEDLSGETRNPVSQKLFDLGYQWREPFIDLRRAVETPYRNHPNDNLPDHPSLFLDNPFSEGKEKREEDKHYSMAAGQIIEEINDWDVEVR